MEIPVLRIKSDDQRLYWEALHTYPLAPAQAEMIFIADGVRPSSWGNWKSNNHYVRTCRESGIMPYSFCTIRPILGLHPVQFSDLSLAEPYPFLKGGRINAINVQISNHLEYKQFPEKFLDSLRRNGYKVFYGRFSTERDPALRGIKTTFGMGDFRQVKEGGLEIRLDSGDSGLGPTHERWFKKLEKKYG